VVPLAAFRLIRNDSHDPIVGIARGLRLSRRQVASSFKHYRVPGNEEGIAALHSMMAKPRRVAATVDRLSEAFGIR
jgi:hypothetical protein